LLPKAAPPPLRCTSFETLAQKVTPSPPPPGSDPVILEHLLARQRHAFGSCNSAALNPDISQVCGLPYKAFRRAAVGMPPQVPDQADREAAGLPAGCKGYALRCEMRRLQAVAGPI
jgi:hypothetical protein